MTIARGFVTAAFVTAALVAGSAWRALQPAVEEPKLAGEPPSPPTVITTERPVHEFAISPDGQHLAFIAVDGSDRRRLWVRSVTGADERLLDGTEGAAYPFWSDNSTSIGFFGGGSLFTISATGGAPSVVAPATSASPGAWRGDVIVFARGEAGGPLFRVPSGGGMPQALTVLNAGEVAHGWPVFLPGSDRVLFTRLSSDGDSAIHVASLDGGDVREVLSDASRVILADGYIVYLRDRALTVQPFDLDMLIPRGDPIHVSEGARAQQGGDGVRAFSVSRSGILAYQVGPEHSTAAPVTLIDWRSQ